MNLLYYIDVRKKAESNQSERKPLVKLRSTRYKNRNKDPAQTDAMHQVLLHGRAGERRIGALGWVLAEAKLRKMTRATRE